MQSIAVRTRTSALSILGFTLLAISLVIYAEFFRRNEKNSNVENTYSNIFNAKEFGNIVEVNLKNRLGSFELKSVDGKWKLLNPREIDAKMEAVNLIIQKVNELKIIKIYEKDAINLSNFSLEQPSISISLKNEAQQNLTYSFGLLNPIDNTTYVTSSNEKVIFQVNSLGRRLETMSLSNFLDSKIFSVPYEKINSYSIFRGTTKNAQLKITKQKEGWKSSTGRLLDGGPLKKYFEVLSNLSSTHIIDEIDEELKTAIDEYLEKPLYRIEIEDDKNKKVVFEVSKYVRSLPTLNIEKRKHILVRSSDKKHVYLFSKDTIPHFQKTQYSFKKLSLKKIFY
jgi:hypothetical protein